MRAEEGYVSPSVYRVPLRIGFLLIAYQDTSLLGRPAVKAHVTCWMEHEYIELSLDYLQILSHPVNCHGEQELFSVRHGEQQLFNVK